MISELQNLQASMGAIFGTLNTGESVPMSFGNQKVGKLTSYTTSDGKHFGLGYIRTKAGGVGSTVKVGEVEGEVVDVPFLTYQKL
jgi:hypothetical protein